MTTESAGKTSIESPESCGTTSIPLRFPRPLSVARRCAASSAAARRVWIGFGAAQFGLQPAIEFVHFVVADGRVRRGEPEGLGK